MILWIDNKIFRLVQHGTVEKRGHQHNSKQKGNNTEYQIIQLQGNLCMWEFRNVVIGGGG